MGIIHITLGEQNGEEEIDVKIERVMELGRVEGCLAENFKSLTLSH